MKITRRRAGALIAGALVLCGVGVGVVVLMNGDDEPARPIADPKPSATWSGAKASPSSKGDRVVISTLDVDAPMLPVGTTSKGAQEVPGSLDATGRWRDGSKPGQPGNTVIVGHTASKGDGVFDDLEDLENGDSITVTYGKKAYTYTVTKEQELPVSKFATVADEIYRRTGQSGVVLMTCGDWNGTRFETTVIVSAKLAAT